MQRLLPFTGGLDCAAASASPPLPAARRPRVRVRRLHGPPRRLRQLLLLGQPPPAGGLPRPRGLHPRALHPERKAALPRGAYVPFGGGSRICIGKRFGQTEVKLVATMLLQRLRLDALPGRTMTIRQMPTLSPKGGLRMRVTPPA